MVQEYYKRIHPIRVDGVPTPEADKDIPLSAVVAAKESVLISVCVCMSNGVLVKFKGGSNEGLLMFIGKLEGLC